MNNLKTRRISEIEAYNGKARRVLYSDEFEVRDKNSLPWRRKDLLRDIVPDNKTLAGVEARLNLQPQGTGEGPSTYLNHSSRWHVAAFFIFCFTLNISGLEY